MEDDPTEHAQEHIHHAATHGGGPKWITGAALTAAFLAALAAVSSSLATTHLTASTLKRIEANDNWNYYQAKSIKSSILDSRAVEYSLAGPAAINDAVKHQQLDDQKKRIEYTTKPEDDDKDSPRGMPGIQAKAASLEKVSQIHLQTHETYEMSATMFHIAIAVVAIAVVAKRKEFWYMSIAGGLVGLYFFSVAFAHAPSEDEQKPEAPATHAAPAAAHAAPATGHPAAAPAP